MIDLDQLGEGLGEGEVLEVDMRLPLAYRGVLGREGPQSGNVPQGPRRDVHQRIVVALQPRGIHSKLREVVRPRGAVFRLGFFPFGPRNTHAITVIQGAGNGGLQGQMLGSRRLGRRPGGNQE